MINLSFEEKTALDAQERYDIISYAMDAADDSGFVNSYIFERALYCFAAIILYPDRKEALATLISINLLDGWKHLVQDGTIQEMMEKYPDELKMLAEEGKIWFEEYSDWAHSARGILDVVQQYSGNIVQSAASRLTQTAESTGVQDLLNVAEDWGMTRDALKPEQEVNPYNVISDESLFK